MYIGGVGEARLGDVLTMKILAGKTRLGMYELRKFLFLQKNNVKLPLECTNPS